MDPQNFRWNDTEFFPHIFISQMLHWGIAVRAEAFSLFYIDFYINDRDILIQILSGCPAFPFMGCHGCCFFVGNTVFFFLCFLLFRKGFFPWKDLTGSAKEFPLEFTYGFFQIGNGATELRNKFT